MVIQFQNPFSHSDQKETWIQLIWEATKKECKKVHTLCEISQKIRDPPPLISQQFQQLSELENWCFLQLLRVYEWGGALNKQIMKSFHLYGPKFDIAVEMFYKVKFSNFLLGQKFVAVEFAFFSKNSKIGPKKVNFAKGAHL